MITSKHVALGLECDMVYQKIDNHLDINFLIYYMMFNIQYRAMLESHHRLTAVVFLVLVYSFGSARQRA